MSTYREIENEQRQERNSIRARTDKCRKYKYKIGTVWNGKNHTYNRRHNTLSTRVMTRIWLLECDGLIGG